MRRLRLTMNTFDNGNNNDLTVGKVGPAAGLSDSVTLIVGNPNLNPAATAGNVGNVRLFGTEKVTISSVGANANDVDQNSHQLDEQRSCHGDHRRHQEHRDRQ